MVKQGSRRRIGDGEQTNVWHIPWLPGDNNGCLTSEMPQELEHIRVVNLMETGSIRWDEEVLNDICNERDTKLIKSIPIPAQSREDSWIWRWEKSGMFSVRSCYRAVQGIHQWSHTAFWKKIWSLELPGKVLNFDWRVCRGCLPTARDLVMKRVQINVKCPWCLVKDEDATHVLFDCSYARSVWTQMGLTDVSTAGYEGHITDIIQHFAEKCSRGNFALILLVCWNLWNRRNRWVWDRVNVSEFGVQALVMNMLHEWKQKCAEGKRQGIGTDGSLKIWRRPQHGWVKVNTDAALFLEWDSTGVGNVIRDEHGQFIRARNHKLQALYSPREAEALGLKEALSWVKELGYKRCVFETDAKELVEACRSAQGNTYFHLIVLDCIDLLKHYDEVLVDYVPRSANVVAHELARATYSMSGVHEWVDTPPDCIRDVLIIDSIE
ncbi:hypothetical protein AgCh_020567 [Apium graveolens]